MTESHYDFIQASRDFPNIQQRGLKERQGDAAPPVGWLVVEDLHVHTYGAKFKWLKQIKSKKKNVFILIVKILWLQAVVDRSI